MTISIDSTLAALIKANERITELEKVQAEYVTLVRKYEELILRHADLVKELSRRVRLDDPVVKGLVEACKPLQNVVVAFDADNLDHARPDWGDTRKSCGHVEIYTGRGGGELLTLRHAFGADEALAAYNARLKEITQ